MGRPLCGLIIGVSGSPAREHFSPARVEGGGARLGILPTAAAVGAQRGRKAKNGVRRETYLEKRSRIKNGTVLREISLRAFFAKF